MAKSDGPDEEVVERIIDVDVSAEMEASFLEYAYSVIYSRALPDARDGLKPVQRRILYSMDDMGIRPDRAHVKSARVVGEVMGKLHPHGDSAIYDALVRTAQPWAMRLPLIDGHGNFGSLDAGPAAMRYTECRMAASAVAMTAGLDEDTVDFRPNYDGKETEPSVLPAAFPNLLVNGTTGIAVGMATNIPPHNLVEVVQALKHLLAHPDATLDDLIRFVPGPDLPTGGTIIGLDGIKDAYAAGRGSFRIRATARIEQVTPRRKGIVITELPYMVGPEKVIEQIKNLVQSKKLTGIADVKDLTDLTRGMHLVIEVKNGINPEALLEQLYRQTKLEDSFGINAVALVEGQPRTLGLRELLEVYLGHRLEVTRRRTQFQLGKAQDRLHLVEGLLLAIVDIDDVIAIIRSSDDVAEARTRLIEAFELSEIQANHILDMQLRQLTRLSSIRLESERDDLRARIARLTEILDNDHVLRGVVSDDLDTVTREFGTPRRTVLLEGSGAVAKASSTPLEIADDPCWVMLSSTGLLARLDQRDAPASTGPRGRHDVIISAVRVSAHAEFGVITSAGRLVKARAIELPTVPVTANAPHLRGGSRLTELVALEKDERPLALTTLSPDSLGLALGTSAGVVKRVNADVLARDSWEVIRLDAGDRLVGAAELPADDVELVFVTAQGQLLHFPASAVRPQGRAGGGVAGIKLGAGDSALWFGIAPAQGAQVVTVSGTSASPAGTQSGSAKITAFEEYPAKGRGTGGVRAHRFLKGEDTLLLAWVGASPAVAAASSGSPVDLPPATGKRDGSGVPLSQPVAGVGSRHFVTPPADVGSVSTAPSSEEAEPMDEEVVDEDETLF
ncbi:DNA gyrase/topoisomerase IV subunit A [Aestuariimicrobium sp. T2.26MG-19.2B]|uniref:DNA gyrase/topoisomerase IV subunit A n=1 Tax=Aestuariimicrobium sp. T2.26MG-19.2B TaxID=3040679 RepID=UPI002477529B|nr:DNA topoisomerase IV subunit A [Aestuariimicrobium sp. T2.26MG-19.2B]CAI9408695.1 DNA gyrase subunit A [Aestuariimicrobium sp. T2.26MG-19.2B]